MKRLRNSVYLFSLAIVGSLAGCDSMPAPAPLPSDAGISPPPVMQRTGPADAAPGAALQQPRSRWTPVRWDELPGFDADPLAEAWAAWQRSCEKPGPVFTALCAEVRQLGPASDQDRRNWLLSRLQPYRVESLQSESVGLLTGYYEPVIEATRLPDARFKVPLYQPPPSLGRRKPWYSRQDIDTLPAAQAELRGRVIAWLADPIAALSLQIQGSGRLLLTEADGRQHMVRLSYAGTNDQPYRSVGRWLLDQGALRDASWPSIRDWAARHPERVQAMLWSNPRITFFREEPLPESEFDSGPRGAQGVPLTAGRSIAVDPASIPYGTPVWLASSGPQVQLQRLVLAQDTGSAITGAVRADFFVGTGHAASELAGRLKQPLRLWVLWPR